MDQRRACMMRQRAKTGSSLSGPKYAFMSAVRSSSFIFLTSAKLVTRSLVEEVLSRILKKLSGKLENSMTSPEIVTLKAQEMARTLAGTFGPGLSVKELIARLSRLLNITFRQAKSLFYGEWQTMPAYVWIRLEHAYRTNLKRAAERADHQAALYRALNDEWNDR